MAAGFLFENSELNLYTAIDERSAAFMALGISAATQKAAIVITTSGTAVGNLLPAAVEANFSCLPIIFISADRPKRLKNCGANQTVNQEDYLKSVCRFVDFSTCNGIHLLTEDSLMLLVDRTWKQANNFYGPVHLNLAIEEPLYPSFDEQQEIWQLCESKSFSFDLIEPISTNVKGKLFNEKFIDIDPSKKGLILAGPWRGNDNSLPEFRDSIKDFQLITGWPIFADPLSGILNNQRGLIEYWELLISSGIIALKEEIQLLRLGPLTSNRPLESFLRKNSKNNILITESDKRCLDPLKQSKQYSSGFISWFNQFKLKHSIKKNQSNKHSIPLLNELLIKNQRVEEWLELKLKFDEQLSEPGLARFVPKILDKDIPIMLSASSPIRDFISFAGIDAFSRRCFSFRGASGIDGNLSLAIGLAISLGPLFFICGDLAFLHDSNALLLSQPKNYPLIILLIDNRGGGIFRTLKLDRFYKGNIEELFSMPQNVDILSIASSYDIPYREICNFDDLQISINWALKLSGPVLIHAKTNSEKDILLRRNITEGLKNFVN